MSYEIPADIRQILQRLLLHDMEVSGPARSGANMVYHVAGHVFSEDELRNLGQKTLLRTIVTSFATCSVVTVAR